MCTPVGSWFRAPFLIQYLQVTTEGKHKLFLGRTPWLELIKVNYMVHHDQFVDAPIFNRIFETILQESSLP